MIGEYKLHNVAGEDQPMSRFEKLVIALICFIVASLIVVEMSHAEVDSNSALHFGGSAAIGFMAGVATQRMEDPTTRRLTAISVCMVPGVAKELTDYEASLADLGFDLLGCWVGYEAFDGVNVYLTGNGVAVAGRW